MDELESLIGKNVCEIDSEIIESLESIDFKVAGYVKNFVGCTIIFTYYS